MNLHLILTLGDLMGLLIVSLLVFSGVTYFLLQKIQGLLNRAKH